MTVTTRAQVKVGTVDMRAAIKAVKAHGSKTKSGSDDLAEFRIRLILAERWIYVCASNGTSTGLAKARLRSDTRGASGKIDGEPGPLDKDDGPLVVDLQPRHGPLMLQMFKAKQANSEVDQLLEIDVDTEEGDIRFTDIGGLWTSGEALVLPFDDPAEGFPDVLAVTSRAIAGIGTSPIGKQLVTDPQVLTLFKDAGKAYGADLVIESTGTPESGGFVVSCGPDFLGLLESRHGTDDSLSKRDTYRRAWLKLLPAQKLVAV